jgi:hypothetical protein
MFPTHFADRVVSRFTRVGETVLDPFAGRGTSLFSAAIAGRHAIGVEINPVGWVYASTKLNPARYGAVEQRIRELGRLSWRWHRAALEMSEFFRWCYSTNVRAFLLAARKHLDWRNSSIDRTVMALLLVDLHGKTGASLSNQMRQTKAMSPDYAVDWWRAQAMRPPQIDPVALMLRKIEWRYANGRPATVDSRVYLGDSTHHLTGLRTAAARCAPEGAHLLFTSPPYRGVTNYHYDQWLRLWLLGGSESPNGHRTKHRGKFDGAEDYRNLLLATFKHAAELLVPRATVYVRTDRRRQTSLVTREVLKQIFPRHHITRRLRPVDRPTQTDLFGNAVVSPGEIDFIMRR